jgi:hypothetical protein
MTYNTNFAGYIPMANAAVAMAATARAAAVAAYAAAAVVKAFYSARASYRLHRVAAQ